MMKLWNTIVLSNALLSVSPTHVACAQTGVQEPLVHEGELTLWAVRPGMISYHHAEYAKKRARETFLQHVAQVVLAGVLCYGAYEFGLKPAVEWFRGGPAAAPQNAAGQEFASKAELAALRMEVTDGSFMGKLKSLWMIIGSAILTGSFTTLYSFSRGELYGRYIQTLKSQLDQTFEALYFSIDQMLLFQTSDQEVFKNHRDVVNTYCQKILLPLCEAYIGFYHAFLQQMPSQAVAYNLNSVPGYLSSLINQKMAVVNAVLQSLCSDHTSDEAVKTILVELQLIHREIGFTVKRAAWVIERET